MVLSLVRGSTMSSKKDIDILIGSNIKRERERAGYTQDQFSEMIGMGSKNLSAVERGVSGISFSALLKICDVLSISSDTLLFKQTRENEVQGITKQLERLTPAQFSIVSDVFINLLKAFDLKDK